MFVSIGTCEFIPVSIKRWCDIDIFNSSCYHVGLGSKFRITSSYVLVKELGHITGVIDGVGGFR